MVKLSNNTSSGVLELKGDSPDIALIVQSSSYGQGVLRGIAEYVRTHRPWSIYVDQWGFNGPLPMWLAAWRGHGVILQSQPKHVSEMVASLQIPTVDVQQHGSGAGSAAVIADDEAIGRLAAQHLMERGFRYFAYIGAQSLQWSEARRASFTALVRNAGHSCYEYTSLPGTDQTKTEAHHCDLAQWLASLPCPLAVMAADDSIGLVVLDACRRANIDVPEQIAVVGVNNDETLCNLSNPPLSSVKLDCELIGFRAAELLDELLRGATPPTAPIAIKPVGVATRRSTDLFELGDSIAAKALRFIHFHACDGISVIDVARHCDIPRKSLERSLAMQLGASPHRLISLVKLSRAQALLKETEASLVEIARECGFTHAPYLNVFFKKETGLTPGEYRRMAQFSSHPNVGDANDLNLIVSRFSETSSHAWHG